MYSLSAASIGNTIMNTNNVTGPYVTGNKKTPTAKVIENCLTRYSCLHSHMGKHASSKNICQCTV